MRQIRQKLSRKARKVLRTDERAEERELRNEINDFVDAHKVLEKPQKVMGVNITHLLKQHVGISEAKKSAQAAIDYLGKAKAHLPRFLALATKIEQEIEGSGVQPTIIAAAGRVIGTARYIGKHIVQYILILDKVKVYEYKGPRIEGIKDRGEHINLSPELNAEYTFVVDSLNEDIKHLVMALRIDRMLRGQT